MSGSAFFDSNVLLYTLAEGDPREAIAGGLLAGGGTISAQVLNEFANVAHRKFGLSWQEVTAAVGTLRAFFLSPCRSRPTRWTRLSRSRAATASISMTR